MTEGGSHAQVRVACVGDSITWGAFLLHRRRDCYPSRLQGLLGETAVVGNFGVIAHTLQRTGDFPYVSSAQHRASIEFAPDIVLLLLGTNDSKARNWRGAAPFAEEYRELVATYRALDPPPAIYAMTLPAVFGRGARGKIRYGMHPGAIDEMCEVIREVARTEGLGLIDTHAATAGHPEGFRFDGVHPGAIGSALIADAAYAAIVADVMGANGR